MTDAELRLFSFELKSAADAARRLAQEHSNLWASMTQSQRNTSAATDEYTDAVTDATKQTRVHTAAQQAASNEVVKRKRIEAAATKKVQQAVEALNEAVTNFGESSTEAVESQAKLTRAQEREVRARAATTTASADLDRSLESSAKSARGATIALDWFGTSLKTQAKELAAQYKAAGGLVEGSGGLVEAAYEQQEAARKMGISGSALQENVNANRQIVNAMGGTATAVSELTPVVDRFRILTGNSADAAKLAMDITTGFALSGIKPTAAVMEAYTNDMVEIRKRTGKSYDEIHNMFEEVAKDSDSIATLRAAREGEREAILASQRALIQQSIAAGMSAEQAKNAAKMLNKMAAAKPLDRLRQAAKIRALGGAMGVAGAEEAAQAVIAGKRMTDEQKAHLNQFSQSMTNTMDTMAGQGLGSEIFGSALLEKLDLEQYYGPTSDFSTTLGTAMQTTEKLLKEIRDVSKTPEGTAIGAALLLKDQAVLLLSGQSMLGLAISGLAAAVVLLAATIKGGKLLDVLGGAGRSPKVTGGGASGGKLGKVANIGKTLMRGAPLIGGAVAAGDEYLESGNTAKAATRGVGAASGAAIGGVIGALGGPAAPITIPLGMLAGGWVGDWAGGKLGDNLSTNQESVAPKTMAQRAVEMKPVPHQQQRGMSPTDADEEMKVATLSTAAGVLKHTQQMDTSNLILQQLATNTARQVELSEKQLIAMTLTEKEKTESINRTNLRRDNKFGASYNYV